MFLMMKVISMNIRGVGGSSQKEVSEGVDP